MTRKIKLSSEAKALLELAGAFNTEEARWALRKHEGLWQVIRETDEPNNIEVKSVFKTNGEAHESLTILSDIAAAKAFLAKLNEMLEEK